MRLVKPACMGCFYLALALEAFGAVSLQGWMTSAAVTGRPEAGKHRWDREIVYLTPLGTTPGPSVGMRMLAAEPGWFFLRPPGGLAAGTHRLFTINLGNIDGGTVGFQYRLEPVRVEAGGEAVKGVKFNPDAHYTVMYNRHYNEWAEEPWFWATQVYQTFRATSTSVTRLATKLAGKDAGPGTHHLNLTLNFAVVEPDNGPPSAWKRISPVRQRFLPGTMDPIIHVLDVNFLSQEVTLVPGRTYAVKLSIEPGSECTRFAVVARPKENGGYPHGRAYREDTPVEMDLYGHVAAGPPGTVVNYVPPNHDIPMNAGDLLGTDTAHGQTFTATGDGLAAVELLYTVGCNPNPPRRITLSLHPRPGGPRIGPAKTCLSVPDVCQGRAAAMWERGEVPLQRGRTYYVHIDSAAGGGINVWSMNGQLPGGDAYVGGRRLPDKDLPLTIAEYLDGKSSP